MTLGFPVTGKKRKSKSSVSVASKSNKAKEDAIRNAIPEFMNYNIVESEVRNVI